MASAFKNAGQANPTTDGVGGNVYTAPSNGTAVLHAVYISNKNAATQAVVDVSATVDGGTTFKSIIKGCICLLYTSPSPRDSSASPIAAWA